ncbi:MAG: STAS domain-containing protein [Steroidobacteraceae bacterium]
MAGFELTRDGDGRLAARGELGFPTAAAALRAGEAEIRGRGDQVVDLGGVTSGDSAGVAVLVEWAAVARAAGARVRYERIPAQMLAIARISDLEDLLLRS